MDMNSFSTAFGICIGSLSTLLLGLLGLYWTKGTESHKARVKADAEAKVKIIEAEAIARAAQQTEVIAHKDMLLATNKVTIEALTARITSLEAARETDRRISHEERNAYHLGQMKCAAETGELKGQIIALQAQVNSFIHSSKPLSVSIDNTTENPVPTTTSLPPT